MAISASDSTASSNSASVAPGSSGLGNLTVGKSGSGLNWLVTVCTSSKPARRSVFSATAPPTPCRGVSATRTGPDDRRTRAARSIYSSTSPEPAGSTGFLAISSANGAPAIAVSISRSVGATI